MNCGGRIYKGEDVSVSIPFNISGYTDLEVSYYTDSEVHIERYEEQLVVEDGFIIAEFDNTDLDLLPDGVLRYTITFKVDGVDYVSSNNTPYYLKTPKDYDAKTAEEVYEDGYESGFTVGHTSGYTDGWNAGYPSGVTDGFALGYPSGHTDGYAEGEIVGKAAGYVSGYTAGEAEQKSKLVSTAFTENGTYTREDGWNEVEVNIYAELFNKSEQMTAKTQTFLPDMPRPDDIGNTVYGGLLSTFEALIDQYTEIRVKNWDNAEHSDWTLEGVFKVVDGVYGYESSVFTPLTACTTQWTNLGSVKVYFDGYDVFFYAWSPYGFYIDSLDGHIFTDGELIFPTKSYYGMSAITVTSGPDENIAYADMAIGFVGPASVSFYDYDTDYKIGRYVSYIYTPDEGGRYLEPDIDERDHGSMTFTGSGYHTIWFGVTEEMPSHPDWISINGTTSVDLVNNDNFDIPSNFDPFHNDGMSINEIDIYGNSGTANLIKYLMDL